MLRAGLTCALVAAATATATGAGPPRRTVTADDLVAAALEARADGVEPGVVALWARVAAVAPAAHPYAPAMHGILLARAGDVDAAVPLLERAAVDRDWVAAAHLAGAYELVARRLVTHVAAGGNASAAAVAPGAGAAFDDAAAAAAAVAAAGSPHAAALERVAALLAAAIPWRDAWLAQCGGGGAGGASTAAADGEDGDDGGDAAAVACADALRRRRPGPPLAVYPQALYARPPTLLYRGLGTALQWLGREGAARDAFAAGAAAGLWATPWARPVVPHRSVLRAPQPIFTSAADPCFAPLLRRFEAALPGVAAEFDALWGVDASSRDADRSGGERPAAASPPRGRPAFVPEAAGLHAGRRWLVLPLAVDGEPQPAACAAAPLTCALLAAEPLARVRAGQAKFSVLRRGARVLPHAGPSDARLRLHCALRVFAAGPAAATLRVGTATTHWETGRCFLFDESFEHEVTTAPAAGAAGDAGAAADGGNDDGNDDDVRAVLIVDIANPLLAVADEFRRHAVAPAWLHGPEGARALTARAELQQCITQTSAS